MKTEQNEIKSKKSNIIAWIVMGVLAVILIPVLAINLTLIIRGSINNGMPPSVFGIAPLAVTSGSMKGESEDSFDVGALIFIDVMEEEEKQSLGVGDIVCFKTDGIFVTHRIVSLNLDGDNIASVVTQGDANNTTDGAIPVENIVGKCIGSVAGLGDFTMFLQTPVGILVFIGIPVLLFIAYDIIRITLNNRRVKAAEASEGRQDAEEALKDKDEEIRRLRALVKAQEEANGNKAAEEGKDETDGQN